MTNGVGAASGWDQARYNLTHNKNDKRTYDTVADALTPGIKKDEDGIVKIKYGASFWDYAEAVKGLSDDDKIKNMETGKLVDKINDAQKNPFDDVDKIKAGCKLDLSKFIGTGEEEDDSDAGNHDSEPKGEYKSCDGGNPDQQTGNTYVNYYENNNNFVFIDNGQQQGQVMPQQQPPMNYTEINYTNNTFVMV